MSTESIDVSAAATQPLGLNFRRVQAQYSAIESSTAGGSDPELQQRIRAALALCEVGLMQVVHLSVFSPNEILDDVNTGDIKLLMLAFYRGELLLRLVHPPEEQGRRVEVLQEALLGLRGFLGDLERLQALSDAARASWEVQGETPDASTVRELKIARMRASRAARARMEVLSKRMGSEEADDDGDELEREHVLLLIECCCHTALDSIRSAEQELDMLQQVSPSQFVQPSEARNEDGGDSRGRAGVGGDAHDLRTSCLCACVLMRRCAWGQ